MRPEPINGDEWVAELFALGLNGDTGGFLSTEEICRATGRSASGVRVLLRRAFLEGRVTVTRKAVRTIDGRNSSVPAYRLAGKIPKRKGAR